MKKQSKVERSFQWASSIDLAKNEQLIRSTGRTCLEWSGEKGRWHDYLGSPAPVCVILSVSG